MDISVIALVALVWLVGAFVVWMIFTCDKK